MRELNKDETEQVSGGEKKSCYYKESEVSHGGVIKQEDGNFYQCNDGEWQYVGN